MPALTGIIITLNEERHVVAALESLAFCDEVLVVDAGSSDRTVELARETGARVDMGVPWPGFVAQRNRALGAAAHDWVLFIDADERVTPGLRTEIQSSLLAGPPRAGYRIPRVAHYLGRWIRATDWYPDLQLRLFDRRCGQWAGGAVHESVHVEGSVGRLRGEIEHYPYADVAEHVRKINRYTTLWAGEAFDQGRRGGVLQLLGASTWAFVRNYLVRRGVTLGWPGLAISLMASHYTALKFMKLRELGRARGASA